MNKDELLLQEHVRIRTTGAGIFVEVRMNANDGADLAVRWALAAALPLRSTPMEVSRARMLVLTDYRYFRVCDTCGDRHPSRLVRSCGDGTDVCQECDE